MITVAYYKGFKPWEKSWLITAVSWVNDCLATPSLKELVFGTDFTFTGDTGKEVWQALNEDRKIEIRAFRPRWWNFRRKKVRAWVNTGKYPDTIFLNANIIGKKFYKQVAGTVAHECGHLAGYGHGSNSPSTPGYKRSVPHKWGSLVRYHQ